MEVVNPDMGKFAGASPDLDEVRMRDQIAMVIKNCGGVKKVSEITGIPSGTLEKYYAKTSAPSLVNAAKISAASGVSLSDITGQQVIASSSGGYQVTPARMPSVVRYAEGGMPDLALLRLFDVEAAAGAGRSVLNEDAVDVIAFSRSFLRDHGAMPDQCTVIRAKGDSMQPTIPDGSLLVVDHSQKEIAHGLITVIRIDNDLLVKRIHRKSDGSIHLISDNPAYPPEQIQTRDPDELGIVGRVVYFCRVP